MNSSAYFLSKKTLSFAVFIKSVKKDFKNVEFGGGRIDFKRVEFNDGDVSFEGVEFGNGKIKFLDLIFHVQFQKLK